MCIKFKIVKYINKESILNFRIFYKYNSIFNVRIYLNFILFTYEYNFSIIHRLTKNKLFNFNYEHIIRIAIL